VIFHLYDALYEALALFFGNFYYLDIVTIVFVIILLYYLVRLFTCWIKD